MGCTKNYGHRNFDHSPSQTSNAASTVASALAANADGIVNLVAQVTLNAQSMVSSRSACGTIRADSTTQQSTAGATTTYTYTNKDKFLILCNGTSQPDSAVNISAYSGNYSNTGVTSNNSGSSVFNIGGVLAAAANYTVDGTYTRSGNYVYNNTTKTTTSSSVNIVLKKLLVSKPQRGIIGGIATFTITGTDTDNGVAATNGNYSYSGTLTFNNTNFAALTLNGTNYTVNLITGAVM